ncbi:MAG: hypothetical protein IJV64_05915 [Oscillospiraceae bacterium]|nr:hypothetical protein [Oscillospiraceae bacterium]
MKSRLDQCVPPGMDGMGEFGTLWGLWVLIAVEVVWRSLGSFLPELTRLKALGDPIEPFFLYYFGTWWFASVLVMLPVSVIVTLLWLAVKTLSHYRFYRRGARADYTMRRLPDRWEYHRRALALPLFGLIGTVLVYLVVLALCIAVYYLVTPGWMQPHLFL